MKQYKGMIKLLKTQRGYAVNRACYHSLSERKAIIESWRLMHGPKMIGWYFVIQPYFLKLNDNKWSKLV